MADFIPINLVSVAPQLGGGAPSGAGGQGGLLSGNTAADSSLLGGDTALLTNSASNIAVTDLFSLLLGQGNSLPTQENFTPLGKNLPLLENTKTADALKPTDKRVDNSVDALQAALASLLVQQSAPVAPTVAPAPADTVSGQAGQDTVVGGVQGVSVNAQPVQDLIPDVGDAEQDAVQQSKPVAAGFANLLQQSQAQDAYRSTQALSQPDVGSTVNTNDSNAVDFVKQLLAGATQEVQQKVSVSADDNKSINVSAVTDSQRSARSADVVNNIASSLKEAVSQPQNNSAVSALPKVEVKAKDVAIDAATKPLAQLSNLQSLVNSAKTDTKKAVVKAEAASNVQSNNTVTAAAPQGIAQSSAQEELSQQFGEKEQGDDQNSNAVKSVDEKPQGVNVQALQTHVQRSEAVNNTQLDFATHMEKAIASPADQIAIKIAQLPSGKRDITVQLEPADLGKVDVKLQINADGKAHISIAAEHRSTLDMLRNDMASLQRSLSDSGIRADAGSLQFSLKGQEFAGQFAQGNSQGNGNNSQQQTSDTEIEKTIEGAAIMARYMHVNNLIDLHV